MIQKAAKITFTWLAVSALVGSCDSDSDKKTPGKPLEAPAVEPPLVRNLPQGLSLANLKLVEGERTNKDIALDALKSLIAPAGDFVGVKQRLEKIDGRMAELDKRAQENQKACLADGVAATDFDLGATLPGAQTFALKLQCQEDIGSDQQLAFGLTSDVFYLTERNFSNGIAVLASAPKNGTSVSVWQIAASTDSMTLIQIYAKDGEGFEATVAGTDTTGQSGAAPCGLHIRAKGDLVYMKASLALPNGCSSLEEYCVSATTFQDVSAAQCVDAGLNTLSLTRLTPDLVTAVRSDLRAAISKKITGFIDFTKDAEVAAE